MRTFVLAALIVGLVVTACGGSDLGSEPPEIDPDAPVLQIRFEGGLTTPEMNLSRGPTHTLLGDGRLIVEGPVIAIYPGPMLPNYQESRLTQSQIDEALALVDEIGLPGMTDEVDDSAAFEIADATTTVITYWDQAGEHQFSVYALGMAQEPSGQAATATQLVEHLTTAGLESETTPYVPERVRVIAGVAQTPPEPGFEDVRPWPLEGEDPAGWTELELGFACKAFGPDLLERFSDATQVTQWTHPVETMDAPPFVLLVRPLLPGEPDCPGSE